MSNTKDTRQPPLEKPEPQQITPQTGELDAEKLDEVVGEVSGGSGTGYTIGYKAPPPPPPII